MFNLKKVFAVAGSLEPRNTGTVMTWVGTALYAALAVGAQAGNSLYAGHGFETAPPPHARGALLLGIGLVPGLALALRGVGFDAITKFIMLLFVRHKRLALEGSHR
jgi:hypothetical protein